MVNPILGETVQSPLNPSLLRILEITSIDEKERTHDILRGEARNQTSQDFED